MLEKAEEETSAQAAAESIETQEHWFGKGKIPLSAFISSSDNQTVKWRASPLGSTATQENWAGFGEVMVRKLR